MKLGPFARQRWRERDTQKLPEIIYPKKVAF